MGGLKLGRVAQKDAERVQGTMQLRATKAAETMDGAAQPWWGKGTNGEGKERRRGSAWKCGYMDMIDGESN